MKMEGIIVIATAGTCNSGTTEAKARGTGISYVLAIAIAIGIRQHRNIRYTSKQ